MEEKGSEIAGDKEVANKFYYHGGVKGFFNSRRNEVKITEIVHFLPIVEKMESFGLCRSFFNCVKREIDFQVFIDFNFLI